MPEYVYRQLYFTGQENLLYYHNKREKEAEEKIKAKQQCAELEKECKAISVQIKVQIDKILEQAYKETITKIN